MKKYIFYIVGLAILSLYFVVSCDITKYADCFGIFYDYSLYLKVQNNLGDNLLDLNNPNHIDIDSVNLYRISKDGCEILLYSQYADISKGFIISGSGNDAIMQLVLDGNGIGTIHYHGSTEIIDYIDSECTLLLKWNLQNTDTDTIFTTFVSLESTKKNPLPDGSCEYNLYDKVYCNNELIVSSWEDNREKMLQGIYPVIIK
jgi:hypothetical protein